MRALILAVVVALVAMPAGAVEVTTGNNVIVSRGSTASGPRILGEPAFALEFDALTPDEVTRPGWPVTTTRASPCMSYDGTTWHTQPENTACVGQWGLESFGGFTQYLPRNADLSTYVPSGGTVVTPSGDHWVIEDTSTDSYGGIWKASGVGLADEIWTSTCEVKAGSQSNFRLHVAASGAGNNCPMSVGGPGCVDIGDGWWRCSCSLPLPVNGAYLYLYIGHSASATGTLRARQCQLTKTDTPMPRHDCGAAACTRAADVHTVSTAGWPTTEGEFSFVVTIQEPLSTERNVWLLDGRDNGTSGGVNPYIQPDGRLRFRVGGTVYGAASPALTWEVGRAYALRFRRGAGTTYIYRDGSLVYQVATADWVWAPYAHLGMNYSFTAPDIATTIRLLRVSQ